MAFSQEVADEICKRLMGGASMREVCAAEDMPARSVVYEWLAENPAFADQYARAAEVRADEVFDEMFAIADNGENDWMQRAGKDEETAWVENGEAIRRSQLRIDTRKWALARMAPRKYGDKLALGGSDDMQPIRTEDVSAVELLKARIDAIASRAAGAPDPG